MRDKNNQKLKIIKFFFLIIFFMIFELAAIKTPVFAAPAISSVSGTIEDNASVTVGGGNFYNGLVNLHTKYAKMR